MQGQNDTRMVCGFLIAVLLHALTLVSTKDVETRRRVTAPSHARERGKESADLEGSEASHFMTHFAEDYSFGSSPLRSPFQIHFPFSSGFADVAFSFNYGQRNSIHQQISCGDNFSRTCRDSRYRSYDGSCNNIENPAWGLANTRYGRLVQPRYSDGIRAPTKSITGENLPLARTVSYTIFPNLDINDRIWTLAAMQYGQIMTHDMALIDGTTQSKSHSTRCCTPDGQVAPDLATMPRCYPMLISSSDPVYGASPTRCLNFVRSTTDLDHGCASPFKSAEQLNTVTHYLDLSLVYGSNDEVAANLRARSGGRLNVEWKDNREFPPSTPNKTAMCDTVFDHEPCYATGDMRANQNPQLTILHIVLLREHNRVADYLAELNPHWTDETIFQETRRIVIAEHQNIAYYEWLPIFLGSQQVIMSGITYNTNDYVNDYDETVNANVLNEHSNAAIRYFHSLIAGNINLVSEKREYFDSLRLSDHFNRPGVIEENDNFDDLTRSLASQPQKAADIYFDREITQYLFRRGRALGSDLRATDVQRDRDHALASYNSYREYCGLPRATNFMDFSDYISFSDIHKLSMLYDDPDDVELTVGGSLERHVPGALAGPTFLCIMLKQFQLTRIGDRYWFETGDPDVAFTIEQLNQLRNSSISRLLCDNADHIEYMQRLGFVQVSEMNPLMRCDNIQQIDLSLWKDYGPEMDDYPHQYTLRPQYKKK